MTSCGEGRERAAHGSMHQELTAQSGSGQHKRERAAQTKAEADKGMPGAKAHAFAPGYFAQL